ncbi:MAG: glycosyltransferase [Anaerolineales bacterium]
MSTFLFSSQPSTGHLNPLFTIARQMQARGHTPVFANFAPPKVKKTIAGHGFRLINIRPALPTLGLTLLPNTSGFVETFLAVRLFYSGILHYARAALPVLDEVRPAAVISDFSYFGACLAAEARGIPYAAIYHAGLSFKGPGIPPFGSGLPIGETGENEASRYRRASDFLERSMIRTIAHARKQLRLPPRDTNPLARPASPWLNLVLTAEASEAPRDPLPPTTFFIGPCFAGRQNAGTFPFERLSPGKPKIYVSLGTVFNRKPRVFSKIIDAFADGRCQLIISAGGAFRKLQSQPPPENVLLFERVPQVELLPRVDAVISHGGNNTTNETLAAGKPLLVMPVGGEQGDNASRVVYLGAGLRADIKRSTSREIGAKIDRLFAEPIFRQRAQAIGAALAQTQGPVTAAQFIERVAQTQQPLLRPEGYPLTVTRGVARPWAFQEMTTSRKL